jgi:hypothetical protein
MGWVPMPDRLEMIAPPESGRGRLTGPASSDPPPPGYAAEPRSGPLGTAVPCPWSAGPSGPSGYFLVSNYPSVALTWVLLRRM